MRSSSARPTCRSCSATSRASTTSTAPPNNPWNLDHTPGGSSGGSGAVLAAGLSALEMGSDIGGSIRTPAHYCGVFGHKPTWSLIPSRGHALPYMVSEPDIAVVGPLARSAFDLELQLRILAHPDRLQSAIRYELPTLAGRTLGDLRVAVWVNDENRNRSTREVASRVERVAQVFRDAGAIVREDARPAFTSAHTHDVYYRLLMAFTAAGEGFGRGVPATPACGGRACSGGHQRRGPGSARDDDGLSYLARPACRARSAAMGLAGVLRGTTTWLLAPQNRGRRRWCTTTVRSTSARSTSTVRCSPTGSRSFWAGLPIISHLPSTVIPTGPGEAGLPIGIQLIGPAYGDLVTVQNRSATGARRLRVRGATRLRGRMSLVRIHPDGYRPVVDEVDLHVCAEAAVLDRHAVFTE